MTEGEDMIMIQQDILEAKSAAALQNLWRSDLGDRLLTENEITHILKLCDALWIHSGNPTDPHVELTHGNCSDGFVDVLRAIRYTNLCEIFAYQLMKKVEKELNKIGFDGRIDWVIGSDHAGAALSHSVATLLKAQHDFTEKGPEKTQLWQRFTIKPAEVVLQVEELMTTSGTLNAVREEIRKGNHFPVTFAPLVAVLVNRSNVFEIERTPVVHLIHYVINAWPPNECPLCAAGSERVRPKQNWAKLTGKQ